MVRPVVGDEVTFDASSSGDIDGEIVRYEWDFNRDGRRDAITSEPNVTHFFESARSFLVRLTVEDDDGLQDTTAQRVSVQPGDLEISANTATIEAELQRIVSRLDASGSDSLPRVLVQIPGDPEYDAALDAVNNILTVDPVGATIQIVFDLAGGDYTSESVRPPRGTQLILTGERGNVTFRGSSPALTVAGGDVEAREITFQTTTDAPTILVEQNSTFTIRDSIVEETSGGKQAAIKAEQGASVDLGTVEDPGGNTLTTHGEGRVIESIEPVKVSGLSVAYEAEGDEGRPFSLDLEANLIPLLPGGESNESIILAGIPRDAQFSAGTENGDASVALTPDQLRGLTMTVFDDTRLTLDLMVDAPGLPTSGEPLVSGTIAITVNNVAPQIDSLSLSPEIVTDENGDTVLSGEFTDPGTDTHEVTIEWGDGSPNIVFSLTDGERSFSVPHDYSGLAPDDYAITVTVEDDDTGISNPITEIVTVKDDDVTAPKTMAEHEAGVFSWDVQDTGTADSVDSGLSEVEIVVTQDTGRGPMAIYTEAVTDVPSGDSVSGRFDATSYGPGQFALVVTAIDGDNDRAGDSLSSMATASATGAAKSATTAAAATRTANSRPPSNGPRPPSPITRFGTSPTADFEIDGAAAGEKLANRFKQVSDGVWQWEPSTPPASLKKGTLTVSVKDRQGNLARIERTFSCP